MKKRNTGLSMIVIALILFIYYFSLSNYFSADDWFHLRVSNISTFREFFNFFSFSHTPQSISFYRPLSTQVFFFVFHQLFGLVAWPYYTFVLVCFGYLLYLLNRLVFRLTQNRSIAQLSVLLYGLSVSNFTRVYFLSAFQEILVVIFSLLCLLSFPKSIKKSLVFFILALLCKETAIVLPVLLSLIYFKQIITNKTRLLPFALIGAVYLFLRLFVFGIVEGDSYQWVFSIPRTINTTIWYFLWSIGAPELLVDYVGSGFRLVPKFFTDFPVWWRIIIFPLISTITLFFVLFIKDFKKAKTHLLLGVVFFLTALLPVLFLPHHKFALELGLPLVGLSLALASLLQNKNKLLVTFAIASFIFLNVSMHVLTYQRHYSTSRSDTAKKIYSYFSKNFPSHPQNSYFEFINDTDDYGKEWGSSKQISHITSGSEMFRVIYDDPSVEVYFEDIPKERPVDKEEVLISTKQFFQVE